MFRDNEDVKIYNSSFRTRIHKSGRALVRALRNWFYAKLNELRKRMPIDEDLSIKLWKQTVTYVIEYLNKTGLTEKAVQARIDYEITLINFSMIFRIKKMKFTSYEPSGYGELEFSIS